MSKIKEYMKLMRIKHYLKNVLIFLPLVFSGELLDIHNLTNCIVGFIIFSFTSSIVYIINDIKDIENDKKHPIKKKRPLPLGTVSKEEAIILALVLGVIAITLSIFVIGYERIIAIMLLLLYLAINVAYSFGLKKKPIVDIVILVAGFLIRVLYGAVITDIELSNWLYLTVISGAFYMGLGKRRNEILNQGDKSREVLKCYTKDFLDKNMYLRGSFNTRKSNMDNNKLKNPAYLFEVSWEVCNKVGGIHTVISTKALNMEKEYSSSHILIGPDVWRYTEQNPEFIDDPRLFRSWRQRAAQEGLRIKVGRWNVAGKPIVILVDFSTFITQKDEIFASFWEKYKLDSISGQWDYIEPALFGYAAGKVIESFVRFNCSKTAGAGLG